MRLLSRTKALELLSGIREEFRSYIAETFEHRALSCDACPTKGACCLDAHFVNVRISRLDADAIALALEKLTEDDRAEVRLRIDEAIERFRLSESDSASRTYACPLYAAEVGCIVHSEAKPLACIAHACYERKEDLPPDRLLGECESKVEALNTLTFGRVESWLPIPLAVRRSLSGS